MADIPTNDEINDLLDSWEYETYPPDRERKSKACADAICRWVDANPGPAQWTGPAPDPGAWATFPDGPPVWLKTRRKPRPMPDDPSAKADWWWKDA